MNVAAQNATCRIRPIAPDDRDALTRFYSALSPDSLEARFHGAMPGIGEGTASFFCGPDHLHREGLVAELLDEHGEPVIVGHVCLEPIRPGRAEMAIAVADRWQHHGLGRAMLSRAIVWAKDHGVTELGASIRGSNGVMIGLVRSMGMPVTVDDGDGGVLDAIIDLGVPLPDAA